tara:strand:+ start:1352 stop:1894 length:543 start_codon:yes stop_codon:yes gene_type:complete
LKIRIFFNPEKEEGLFDSRKIMVIFASYYVMSLQKEIMDAMKVAMKAKDSTSLEALRAVKSALLLAQTETGGKDGMSETEEVKLLQKLVKQRKDSAAIFEEQGRTDLAEPELAQAEVISRFLPAQASEEEIAKVVDGIIAKTGASSMQDMGKVMGLANQELAGKADGKAISTIVKQRLMG